MPPTSAANASLRNENIDPGLIFETGNTGIDSLFRMQDLILKEKMGFSHKFTELLTENNLMVLVTTHRRESFGKPLENICKALTHLAEKNTSLSFIFPVHPNPNVSKVVESRLGRIPNIKLIKPLNYSETVALMSKSLFILTDSGGIQEEAASLGKQVLVLRSETERTEAVKVGLAHLVGTNPEVIVSACQNLIDNGATDRGRQHIYGDGRACARIAHELKEYAFRNE